MPSETASVMAVTSSAPDACATSASAGTSSSTPKKFGDCTTTAARARERFRFQRGAIELAGRGVADLFNFQAQIFRVGVQNLPVFGMHGARDQHVMAAGEPLGHQHGFGERRRAVVHGGVGDFLAGELAHQSLKLENRGERALREFRLVRRVGSEEFAALDQRIGHHRAQMLVDARAEKRSVAARIFRGARLKILDDLGFGKRAGQIEAARAAGIFPESM